MEKIFKNSFSNYELLNKTLEFPQEAYSNEIDQYFAASVLEILRIYAIDNDYYKIIGIFPDILYRKFLHYIFGLAEYGDEAETRASIISSVRLKVDLNTKEEKINYFEN